MDLEKYPKELTDNRQVLEASFVMGLWKNPELYYEYKNINSDIDNKTLIDKDGIFYFLLGKQLYEKGYRVFDEVTVENHLSDLPLIKEKFNDNGGMKTVNELLSLVSSDNIEGYYDNIVKANLLLKLYDTGFNVMLNIDKFNQMTAEEVYYFYEYQLNSISNATNHSFQIEDLSIDEEFISECNAGMNKGLDYGKTLPILNDITMGLPLGELYMVAGFSGVGKALPLTTRLVTPFGYRQMKDLRIGDTIIDEDGLVQSIEGVYPQGELDAYEMAFDDGSKEVCSLDHLWKIKVNNGKYKIQNTKQIINHLKNGKVVNIPLQKPCDKMQPSVELKRLKKYVSMPSLPEVAYTAGKLMNTKLKHLKTYSLGGERILQMTLEDRKFMLDCLIKGYESWQNKPMRVSSESDSLHLARFRMLSYHMAKDIRLLLLSLGYRAKIIRGLGKWFVEIYETPPRIISVTKLNKKIEMQCIKVTGKNSTFLCGDYIVTHNTSFTFANMVMPLNDKNIKCAIISNEQRSKDFKLLLISHILTNDLGYYGLTRKQLKYGRFNAEELSMLKKAIEISKEKYSNLKFIKIFDSDMNKVHKVIKQLSQVGYQMFLFDTMKSEDKADNMMWQQLLLNSRKLHQLASKNNVSIVCTYQLALSKLQQRYLDANALSNSKQIKEVFSEMIYFRNIADDEYDGEKFDIKPYVLVEDEFGDKTGERQPIVLDRDKRYLIAFVDKTRNDEDKKQILYEFDGRFNKWKEIGMCKVLNILN